MNETRERAGALLASRCCDGYLHGYRTQAEIAGHLPSLLAGGYQHHNWLFPRRHRVEMTLRCCLSTSPRLQLHSSSIIRRYRRHHRLIDSPSPSLHLILRRARRALEWFDEGGVWIAGAGRAIGGRYRKSRCASSRLLHDLLCHSPLSLKFGVTW
jgi:hypothetical protein